MVDINAVNKDAKKSNEVEPKEVEEEEDDADERREVLGFCCSRTAAAAFARHESMLDSGYRVLLLLNSLSAFTGLPALRYCFPTSSARSAWPLFARLPRAEEAEEPDSPPGYGRDMVARLDGDDTRAHVAPRAYIAVVAD